MCLCTTETTYTIFDKKTGKELGSHTIDSSRDHDNEHLDDMVRKYFPLENHLIQASGYTDSDVEGELVKYWSDEKIELHEFLIKIGYIQLH